METWMLSLLLKGLIDISDEESPDFLETYTDSPIFQSNTGNLMSYLILFLLLSSFLPLPHRRPSTSTSP